MPAVATAAPSVRRSILIVEDDVTVSGAIDLLLRHYDYDVRVAPTVRDARRLLAAGPPDLVVLDLGLPDGDGLDLLEQIRCGNRPVRVAVLTATDDADHQRRLRRLKPDRYFRKPLHFLDLLEGIRAEAAAAGGRAA